MRCFLAEVASAVAQPGSDMPNASVRQAMVLAVNIPLHEPHPGHAVSSSFCRSVGVSLLAITLPIASKTVFTPTFSPVKVPLCIAPPVRLMAGMSSRAAAMSMPGVILSQLEMRIKPSRRCA